MRAKKAFTLVELLVVISIIAILLAVLMPALNKAKEQGRMVICRSNLKGMVMGAALWSNEHDGYVIAGDWFKDKGDNGKESSLGPYIGVEPGRKSSIMTCPTAVHSRFFKTDPAFETDATRYTFAENGYLTYNFSTEGSPGRKGVDSTVRGSGGWVGVGDVYWTEHGMNKLIEIRQPAQTVYFIDHEYYFANSWVFNPRKTIAELSKAHPDYKFQTRWHNKKPKNDYGVGDIGWVDGHASIEPSDMAGLDSDGTERWRYYFYKH
ncbi:MAG: prepilin-type N-terminal cleavage/methylation domain-containing protein [Planctomycetaceae bacterium]|nr:prepilin-type N-terminal cleavage/methylation domain-containing protein [Planctomycetaceae bacterium]